MQEELLRPNAIILPAAARVWAMAVEILTDPGVPVHMEVYGARFPIYAFALPRAALSVQSFLSSTINDCFAIHPITAHHRTTHTSHRHPTRDSPR